MDRPTTPQDRFLLNPLPTLTQLSRIRYTIDVLLQQQTWLALRFAEITPSSDPQLTRSCHLHAADLLSGWTDVQRLVGSLMLGSFERLEFQDEIDQGVAGLRSLTDRYSPRNTQ